MPRINLLFRPKRAQNVPEAPGGPTTIFLPQGEGKDVRHFVMHLGVGDDAYSSVASNTLKLVSRQHLDS